VSRGRGRSCWAPKGELPDVVGRGGQQRLDPDGVEAPAARSVEPASLLVAAEDGLDPGFPLTDETTRRSGAEIGDGAIPQAAIIGS
jgi:hypothetical protein